MTTQPEFPSSDGSKTDFERMALHFHLTAEATKVVESPQFLASPTLTRLLKYLVAETIAGRGGRIKSYAIAVDGLGRSEDFDSRIDSYPRVQVGRLKRALESHYAQVRPTKGLCLFLEPGSYRVHLGAVAAAYPQLHPPTPLYKQTAEFDPPRPTVKHCSPQIAPLTAVLLVMSATGLIFLAVLAAILLATEIEPLTYETVKHSLPGHQVSTLCPQPQRTVSDPWGLGSFLPVQNCR